MNDRARASIRLPVTSYHFESLKRPRFGSVTMTPHVRPVVGRLVGWIVCLSLFPKRVESYMSMVLSDHLFC